MKKFLLIGLIVALVLIFVGGAGAVYARVAGVENGKVLTVTTDQFGNTITRQQYNDENGITTYGEGNLLCQNESQGECNSSYGPGGMMQGYGYGSGGMMGGQQRGNRQGGMMNGYGPGGMMGGYGNGYGPGGMMGGRGDGYGPGMMAGLGRSVMHDYMIAAFASAVGLTTDDVNTRLANDETLQQIALAQGKTEADLPTLWTEVRQAALTAAVADAVITQAQADKMLKQMENYTGSGFGPGFDGCPMMDGDETQQP
jgi:hypothetical protein